jgi:hypothetical protein
LLPGFVGLQYAVPFDAFVNSGILRDMTRIAG